MKLNARVSVGVYICNDHSHFLVVKKAKTQEWGLPGGKVETGEHLTETAKRETLEETGLKINVGRLIGCFSNREAGYFMVFAATSKNTDIVLEPIFDEYRWITIDEIKTLGKVRPRLKRLFDSCKPHGIFEVVINED